MDSKELQDGDVSVEKEFQCCMKCSEWEEKCKQTEERFTELKSEFESNISELRFLQGKLSELGGEKLVVQDEVASWKKKNEDVEEKITPFLSGTMSIRKVRKQAEVCVDLTEDTEDNKFLELMIENRVLDCEKKKAESEVQVWKSKCKKLESRIMELERQLTSGVGGYVLTGMTELGPEISEAGREETNVAKGSQGGYSNAVTPLGDTYRNVTPLKEGKRGILYKSKLEQGSRARKQLFFGEETSFSKKIAPATPAGVTPASHNVIDVTDSDDERDASGLILLNCQGKKEAIESTDCRGGTSLDKEQFPSEDLSGALDQSDEDNVTCHNGSIPRSTCKRKRASNMITSDSESDMEDHFPISRLTTKSKTDATSSRDEDGEPVVRRRLVTLRNLKENKTSEEIPSNLKSMKAECLCGLPTNQTSEEDESETEGGSLDDFIACDSDISNGECASKGDHSSTDGSHFHGDESDDDNYYGDIIARIGRYKDHKLKWEFQADMQAAFGKDPELCMKAVCTLYRQQTPDEKLCKATIVRNKRGLSQVDAYRGSKLGEFLTDGDPQGDLSKSVEELEKYDPRGLEKCRNLALHYSDQLFKLYQSGKDPLWLPSESK